MSQSPANTFSDLEGDLRQFFPYESFKPLQAAIIRRCLDGKNTLGLMPTGGGKSLIYQFCAVKNRGVSLVVVLSPLIALMQDQYDRAKKLGIRVTFLASTVLADEREKRLTRLENGEFELLFVTPERFKNARFREVIAKRKVGLLVVDEAHCVSLWSHDFRPEYGKISGVREFLGKPPILALTATATPDVRKDILSKLGLQEDRLGGRSSDVDTEAGTEPMQNSETERGTEAVAVQDPGVSFQKRLEDLAEVESEKDLDQETALKNETLSRFENSEKPRTRRYVVKPGTVPTVDTDPYLILEPAQVLVAPVERPELVTTVEPCYGFQEKLDALKERLEEGKPTLVYFLLIDTLEKVAREIRRWKIPHRVYHGDLMASQRKKNQRDFLDDRDWLMLATPAFGLGVDKPNIRKVIHFEMPGSIEAYFQEIGRGGRDGLQSVSTLLFDEEDTAIVMEFLKWSYPEEAYIRALFNELKHNLSRYNAADGMDALREKLSFKNRRDYRLESALNILERWGSIARSSGDTPQIEIVSEPSDEDFSTEQQHFLQKQQNMKLLDMLRWASNDSECRMQRIYEYFGFSTPICGECDICQSAR